MAATQSATGEKRMKLVPLLELPGLKTTEIIKAVIEHPPGGANAASMKAGVRVLDALDKSVTPTGLLLEDADHALLAKEVAAFPFNIRSKDLLTIIDGIVEAKEPPSPGEA